MSKSLQRRKLPKGWHWARFDEFLHRMERKVTIDDLSFYDCVGVRWYGMGAFVRENLPGINIARKQQWLLKTGDVVYNKLFAWKSAFAIADAAVDGCIVSDKFPTYQLDVNIANPQFLRYYFHTIDIALQALALSKGGAAISKLTLNPPQFWDLVAPLPPLDEQQRIVARIEELAAKIKEAHRLHQEAIEERESLKEAAASALFFDHDELSQPLRDLVTLSGGGTPSKSNPFFWEGTIPWISPKDMKVRDISDSIDHISEQAIAESTAKLIEPGAVLIVVRGMILSHTVPSAVLRVPATINQDMKALIPNKKLLPEYLRSGLWALNKELLQQVEKSTHDTRKLETSKLLEWKIPVPPLSEQQHIVAYLDELQSQVDTLKRTQAEISIKLDAMLPSILDKAFKGEL